MTTTRDLTIDEACVELGVQIGDSKQMIKAAYRRRLRQTHPDRNPGLDSAAFMRVQVAYERLRDWMKENGTWDLAEAGSALSSKVVCRDASFDESIFEDDDSYDDDVADEAGDGGLAIDIATYVAVYFAINRIEILFDGNLHAAGTLRMASRPDEVATYLDVDQLDLKSIEDDIVIRAKQDETGFRVGDVQRALRRHVRQARIGRKKQIAQELFVNLTPALSREADAAWLVLAAAVTDLDPDLAVAILKHFAWQVKCKLLGRPVVHHLMPVIWGAEQGSGKTTFVRAFLRPLRELATHPVALADLVDLRSGDIFRFPAVFVDDMSSIADNLVADFKSMLTADELRRRRLGTSESRQVRQLATFIGTSNRSIENLIRDDTGHRRFAMIPFRNGAVVKGGDAGVWTVVENTNYELLWRSVDAFADSPIKPQLAALQAHQAQSKRKDPLLAWLLALDFTSDAVRDIHDRDGFPAEALWKLSCEQSVRTLTLKAFGTAMKRYAEDPTTPVWSSRSRGGRKYRIETTTPEPSRAPSGSI